MDKQRYTDFLTIYMTAGKITHDKEKNTFNLNFGHYTTTFNTSIIGYILINKNFSKQATSALNSFQKFYADCKDIDTVIQKGYDFGLKILDEAANLALKSINELSENGEYSLDKKIFLNFKGNAHKRISILDRIDTNCDCAVEIWQKYFLDIEKKQRDIVNGVQDERGYNQARKDNRTLVGDSEFDLAGAPEKMAKAGAINAMTAATDTMFNILSNMRNENKSEEALYNNPATLETLILGLNEAIQAVKMRVCSLLQFDRFCSKEANSDCEAILYDIENGIVPNNKVEEALVRAFLANPFNIRVYMIYLQHFGDKDGSLNILAKFFLIEDDINFLKALLIKEKIAKNARVIKKEALINSIDGKTYAIDEYIKDDPKTLINDYHEVKAMAEKFNPYDELTHYNSIVSGLLYDMKEIINDIEYDMKKPSKGRAIKGKVYTNSEITEITIDADVETIPAFAFANCQNLKTVNLPKDIVNIGTLAFANCKNLETINLPNSIDTIEAFAFANCEKLQDINLPDSIRIIGRGAFYNCALFIQTLPKKVESIYPLAFRHNVASSSLKIPEKVTKFGIDAFSDGYVKMPDTLEMIVGNPLLQKMENSVLFDISSSGNVADYFKEYDLDDMTQTLTHDKVMQRLDKIRDTQDYSLSAMFGFRADFFMRVIGKHAFKDFNEEMLFQVNLTQEIHTIEEEAFLNAQIKFISFDNGSELKEIGKRAFYNCKNLEGFFNGLPAGLETIGDEAFVGCDNLNEIVIPPTVKNIGKNLFSNPNIVVICKENSPIYKYCQKHNLSISHKDNDLYLEGKKYELGNGVEKNPDEAFEKYQDAAELCNVRAMYEVAECYAYGFGVEKDLEKAFEHYKYAATAGNIAAKYKLGMCYLKGKGTDIDEKEAFKYLKEAADLGSPVAKVEVAYCYEKGIGTDADDKLAFKYYKEAADLDNEYAIFSLGRCYERGFGVQANNKLAFEYYKKAANKDYYWANGLGHCYEKGIGVPINLEGALIYYRKAYENDAKNNKRYLINFIKRHPEILKPVDTANISSSLKEEFEANNQLRKAYKNNTLQGKTTSKKNILERFYDNYINWYVVITVAAIAYIFDIENFWNSITLGMIVSFIYQLIKKL